MSRTESFNLPRLPTSHTRLTSPQSIEVHPAVNKPSGAAGGNECVKPKTHKRSVSEPSYTAYLGTPRQDIPHHVYRDAAMFDDVFEKQGRLFHARDTPKIINPLHSLGYSSLHDPHCQKLFLNNKSLRSHLMDLGLITSDLKVVASTNEQRQKIRAHELLERKESLLHKLEAQEQQRIQRLQNAPHLLPSRYLDSMLKSEERRERAKTVQQMKMNKIIETQEQKKKLAEKNKLVQQRKMKQAVEKARLYEQAKRNAARYRQECTELAAYEKQYGKFGRQLALWRRDSDRIHNRMALMERTGWSKLPQKQKHHPPPEDAGSTPTKPSSPFSPHFQNPDILKFEPIIPAESRDLSSTVSAEQDSKEEVTGSPQSETKNTVPVETDVIVPVESDIDNIVAVKAAESETEAMHETKFEITNMQDVENGISNLKVEDKETKDIENVATTTLDRDESNKYLASVFIDALRRIDDQNSGFVSIDSFTQLLNSRDLGLQLNENELFYIAEQVDPGNGWVSFESVAHQLPEFLIALYNQRAELQVQHYGAYMEDQWCQMYLSSGITYYNKLTGNIVMGKRPEDYRSYLKEDPFEESIVDFFETADSDKDGVIDVSNFYSLLVSPMVSTRIYSNQIEDLLAMFQQSSDNGLMALETFTPIAKMLLVLIYQNAYPDVEEWIELDSRKFGTFFFSTSTGETYIQTTLAKSGEQSLFDSTSANKTNEPRSSYNKTADSKDVSMPNSDPKPQDSKMQEETEIHTDK